MCRRRHFVHKSADGKLAVGILPKQGTTASAFAPVSPPPRRREKKSVEGPRRSSRSPPATPPTQGRSRRPPARGAVTRCSTRSGVEAGGRAVQAKYAKNARPVQPLKGRTVAIAPDGHGARAGLPRRRAAHARCDVTAPPTRGGEPAQHASECGGAVRLAGEGRADQCRRRHGDHRRARGPTARWKTLNSAATPRTWSRRVLCRARRLSPSGKRPRDFARRAGLKHPQGRQKWKRAPGGRRVQRLSSSRRRRPATRAVRTSDRARSSSASPAGPLGCPGTPEPRPEGAGGLPDVRRALGCSWR